MTVLSLLMETTATRPYQALTNAVLSAGFGGEAHHHQAQYIGGDDP